MIDTSTYLGEATVTQLEGPPGHVRVELPTGEQSWARLALAVPYRPAVGDELLVIAHEAGRMFAIGLLRGTGETALSVPGDLSIEAGGKLRLRAPELEISAGRIAQRARQFLSWVSGLFQSKSRRMRLEGEELAHVKGGRAVVTAKGDVRIDGKQIHLG
jgi:hypothetical protein